MATERRASSGTGHRCLGAILATGLASCLLLALFVCNAVAQVNDTDCDGALLNGLKNYLREQQKYVYGLVYAACIDGKDGKALLLLPLSNHSPLENIFGAPREPPPIPKNSREAGVPALFYYQAGCVTNGAALAVEKHSLRLVDIVQGGDWEINVFGNIIRELSQFPLSFLPPDKVMEVLQAKPAGQCHVIER